jgi:hypothetical protein
MQGRTVGFAFLQAMPGNKMYKDMIYKYFLSSQSEIIKSLQNSLIRHHCYHHNHHMLNLINLQPL